MHSSLHLPILIAVYLFAGIVAKAHLKDCQNKAAALQMAKPLTKVCNIPIIGLVLS